MAFGVRPAMKRVAAVETKVDKVPELPVQEEQKPALAAPEPPPVDPERLRAQEILEQVTGAVKKQPAQSSRLLQSWIHSD
jgi:flagellar M-ring protein FliF